ncbi:GNAT family N-acetyltransferase [Fundicoccus culcitae]|uniref:GNAT family N-acetyltransferase n=1 Tax=Fundicoccus culcitae TaxID=2969821 RepID=A0ABY5P3P2_9LACT|nr:GNAT family N-acetyltransferase [Fundicoccus culcitae]UUX33196.1 GNAT family N-acetyltransferase [Fundicoccus culcitae]
MIEYSCERPVTQEQLQQLYTSVGWTVYLTCQTPVLTLLKQSRHYYMAWDGNQLVGLVRVVGDGGFVAYIQDVLVHPTYQRQGIGSQLMQLIFKEVAYARQIILTTDEQEATVAFYQSLGMQTYKELGVVGFLMLANNEPTA